MQNKSTYGPSVFASVLLCGLLAFIYPYYQYYVDPDATAYLTIAKRYAGGDYHRAVNGYWSPWSCWLTALLIKGGVAAMRAAIIINTLAATGWLFITQSFFIKFKVRRGVQLLLNITLSLFLVYAVFWQSFADLWEVFFLLCSLRLMLVENYEHKAGLWVLNGIVGAFAYFSKAYAFPFFILNVVCCGYLITNGKENTSQWLKMSIVPVVVMIACSMPWIIALHNKYGMWMTSTAGTLNRSWYLVGHPFWERDIEFLVPPIYMNSPYYWEDPYLVNGETPQFYSSAKLFALQIVKCFYNLLKMVKSMSELSVLFVFTSLMAVGSFFSPRLRPQFGEQLRVVILSFLLFPLAFMLVNFEPRYIWYMLPLSMILGVLMMEKYIAGAKLKKWLLAAFCATYLVTPLWGLKDMYRAGYAEYELAGEMKAMNIKGSFTANVVYGPQMQNVTRLAYFSGNSYYNIPKLDLTHQQLLAEMRRYRVKYYFHYSSDPGGGNIVFADEQGQPFPEVSFGRLKGLKVFLVNP